MKFFDTHFETFSCNLLLNEKSRNIYHIQKDIENYSKEIDNMLKTVCNLKRGRFCVTFFVTKCFVIFC